MAQEDNQGAEDSGAEAAATVAERVQRLLGSIPAHVTVVAAAKGTEPEQVVEALHAGIHVVGHNHIPEARRMRAHVPTEAEWHHIGRLRPHDVRASTLRLFDMLQTVDSLLLAERIDAVCRASGMHMPVLVEVNSGREPQKAGVMPEQAEALVCGIARLTHVHVSGLMTMGPLSASPDEYRVYFAETRRVFESIGRLDIPGVDMRHLSMGMSGSYRSAILEGATMIRVGTLLFGNRPQAAA